jgi:hypothetical protein
VKKRHLKLFSAQEAQKKSLKEHLKLFVAQETNEELTVFVWHESAVAGLDAQPRLAHLSCSRLDRLRLNKQHQQNKQTQCTINIQLTGFV